MTSWLYECILAATCTTDYRESDASISNIAEYYNGWSAMGFFL